jgi:hypothetical protein
MNDIKRNVDINVDVETGEIPKLNSSNKVRSYEIFAVQRK